MARRTQILVGGEGAYDWLKELADNNESTSWSCGKHTKSGEQIFVYAVKPTSAIVATGLTASDARPDKDWHYVADITNIKLIKRPITREELLTRFDKWGWPQQPHKAIYPEEYIVNKLRKLANRKGKHTEESPSGKKAGGGLGGTPEQNRELEQAACMAVQKYFEEKGCEVNSREAEKIGYDFDVRRKGEDLRNALHIEVKGVSGSLSKFIITANEVNRSRHDAKFRLALVTNVKTPSQKIRFFTGASF